MVLDIISYQSKVWIYRTHPTCLPSIPWHLRVFRADIFRTKASTWYQLWKSCRFCGFAHRYRIELNSDIDSRYPISNARHNVPQCWHRRQINFREEAGPTEYMVWYCRMLTSGFLKLNADRYDHIDAMYGCSSLTLSSCRGHLCAQKSL